MVTTSNPQTSSAVQPTDPAGPTDVGTAPDGGLVTLVAPSLDRRERTWNFTVSESSFPSWAWR